jgi:hypothetical protein
MSESNVWSKTGASRNLGEMKRTQVSGVGAEPERKTDNQTVIEKFRLIVGFLMLISGLYFGLFSTGIGVSLGFLSFMTSPFVMVTDK